MDQEQIKQLKGFEYDPVLKVFYTPQDILDSFEKPKGYEDWTVSPLIVDSYYTERITNEMGITEEENIVQLFGGVGLHDSEKVDERIFSYNKHGDIEILNYSLHRKPFTYTVGSETDVRASKNKEKYAFLTRLCPRREAIFGKKYDYAKGKTGNHLMWHPELIRKFEEKEKVKTLVLTEGYFKAYLAVKYGIDCVGLPSISIYTENKGDDQIHPEIIEFITECEVENVIILWDGDCINISSKALLAGEDISKRPNGFVKMADNIRTLLRKDFSAGKLNIFFGRIKSEDIAGNPKGLDDLLIKKKNKESELNSIKRELSMTEGATYFIRRINISTDVAIKSVRSYFKLDYVEKFYQLHKEIIQDRDFVFRSSTYFIKDDKPVMKIPANVKKYVRIGVDYYKMQEKLFPSGKKDELIREPSLDPWNKATIVDDHGKAVINQITRYKGFTNIPSHTNYQQQVEGYWNLYNDISHEIREGQCKHITDFVRHIFGDQYEMGLDYMKLMYEKPMQKLPVLCLVSREQETGKSTFVQLLKLIFKSNMSIISNEELENSFNSSWIDKKIVACEETALEKASTYEKIKSLSTALSVERHEKNKSASAIPCILSFVFCSNAEDSFLRMSEDDKRFWVRKVPSLRNTLLILTSSLKMKFLHSFTFLQIVSIQHKGPIVCGLIIRCLEQRRFIRWFVIVCQHLKRISDTN
ncbi:MAG: DUF5906 domain-containing protein [Crocinitomicaceae bacterium]|nr:DUF5906 domain-containing protein [Crocinitomicaceae bacterium]